MPVPGCECVLSISRVGRTYVVEDGTGGLITEASDLHELADDCPHMVRRRHHTLVAKGVAAWLAVRGSVEEKVEAVAGESVELLTHVAPQLAAFV
jgi:hypothetical protein